MAWDEQQRLVEDFAQQQRQRYPGVTPAAHDSDFDDGSSPLSSAADNDRGREAAVAPPDARFTPSRHDERGQSAAYPSDDDRWPDDDAPCHNDDAPLPQDNLFGQPAQQTPAMDSLIHPFLMRQKQPRQKPSTPLPTMDLLTAPPLEEEPVDMFALEQTARLVEARLADYRVKAGKSWAFRRGRSLPVSSWIWPLW